MQSIANKKLFKKIGNLFALYLYQTLQKGPNFMKNIEDKDKDIEV